MAHHSFRSDDDPFLRVFLHLHAPLASASPNRCLELGCLILTTTARNSEHADAHVAMQACCLFGAGPAHGSPAPCAVHRVCTGAPSGKDKAIVATVASTHPSALAATGLTDSAAHLLAGSVRTARAVCAHANAASAVIQVPAGVSADLLVACLSQAVATAMASRQEWVRDMLRRVARIVVVVQRASLLPQRGEELRAADHTAAGDDGPCVCADAVAQVAVCGAATARDLSAAAVDACAPWFALHSSVDACIVVASSPVTQAAVTAWRPVLDEGCAVLWCDCSAARMR